MSLSGYWSDLISGQPFGTTDGLAATNAAVDAQEQNITDQQLASGLITQSQYATIQNDYSAGSGVDSSTGIAAQETGALATGAAVAAENPAQVLSTGLQWEGQVAGKTISTVGGGLGSGLKSLIGGVPFWMWAVGAIALFLYLGGGGFVERRARARLSQ